MRYHGFVSVLLTLLLAMGGIATAAGDGRCPDYHPSDPSAGPYNFNDPRDRERLARLVEGHHFTTSIRRLDSDNIGFLGRNLDYTLRASPNHHQALRSMSRLVQRAGTTRPEGLSHALGCWFSRAQQYQPDDGMVPMIHGMYYYDVGEYEEALEKMRHGLDLQPNNRNIHYNIALVYFELGRYGEAREHAKEAYDRGFPLGGLRSKLQAEGQW